jgi:molecular chaperone DnaJ
MRKDYYKVLGISRDADDKDIKSAYRRLARKHHPDVNHGSPDAEAKFKEISEAYQVLGDPEKRRKYDQFGSDWENGGFTWTNPNSQPGEGVTGGFGDLFEQIFSNFGGGVGGVDPRQNYAQADDITHEVEVSLEEIMKGTKKTIQYQATEACAQCRGYGVVRTLNGRQAVCPECSGAGVKGMSRKVTVTIPVGVAEGAKLRVPAQGCTGANGKSGDLYALIRMTPHPDFKRIGDDLESEVAVDYLDAVLGGEVKVTTLQGTVVLTIPEGTQPGQRFRLKGRGLPSRSGGVGDLYARIKVSLPREVSPEQRRLLQQLKNLNGARL